MGRFAGKGLARPDGRGRPSGCAGGARRVWACSILRTSRYGTSPADSSSASSSRRLWPGRPTWCSSTSPRPGWTPRARTCSPPRSPRAQPRRNGRRGDTRHRRMPCAPTWCSCSPPRGGARPALGRPHARGAAETFGHALRTLAGRRARHGFGTRPRRARPCRAATTTDAASGECGAAERPPGRTVRFDAGSSPSLHAGRGHRPPGRREREPSPRRDP